MSKIKEKKPHDVLRKPNREPNWDELLPESDPTPPRLPYPPQEEEGPTWRDLIGNVQIQTQFIQRAYAKHDPQFSLLLRYLDELLQLYQRDPLHWNPGAALADMVQALMDSQQLSLTGKQVAVAAYMVQALRDPVLAERTFDTYMLGADQYFIDQLDAMKPDSEENNQVYATFGGSAEHKGR
ncbi:hypothetical protein SAMN05421823_1198 [Catalinimonas alkaloidigena]|uniref:Uncharacterized protein n=1 Tax=Catalinimonas alkaloidigena TaxID=1075417 RepID=A0A1G9V3P2_9BACT|nr:hypothetical protein [Catalinimonas alkaloidigena]SDM66822.1 hypothetical protein SAMN05421823_1198 [Catalinimonas alkaloidigena]